MGVSGSGKTTVGRNLADRLGVPYAEADEFHPPANIAKMSAGHPLTDEDRWPWLRAIADWIREHPDGGVVTCSALKRSYRDLLRTGGPVFFVHLSGVQEVIAARLAARQGHFMPPALLASQLADLEPLDADEPGVVLNVDATPEALTEAAYRATQHS
ncbi:gluconokinase [Actinocrispum sp. NPDC049592]|uniref:gluconokinase n=1 Tax=Actinocrispum sp. NPDC049592 TaxID=3154835 RepID=UPI00342C31B7